MLNTYRLDGAVDIICEFLEVTLHEFFYYTKYYKSVYFERRLKYGTIVYMCRVPEVVSYIYNLVKSLKYWIAHNELKSISYILKDIKGNEIESLVICYSLNSLKESDQIDFDKLEQSLKRALDNMASSTFQSSLPENTQFDVVIDCKENNVSQPREGWNEMTTSAQPLPVLHGNANRCIQSIATVFVGFSTYQLFVTKG